MQRVAIGRMLVREAAVFLMDEPISHLDAKLRAHMRVELKRLQREINSTTLFVSHDQLEAMTMGDRIVVMNYGEIQQFDTPQRTFDMPANITESHPGAVRVPSLFPQKESGLDWFLRRSSFSRRYVKRLHAAAKRAMRRAAFETGLRC